MRSLFRMAITPEQLQPHLEDYAKVTGSRASKFVCPLTLMEVPIDELINGHILNGALDKASRRKVVQWKEPDHFYGRTVEAGMVRYLNAKNKDGFEILREMRYVELRLCNGATFT